MFAILEMIAQSCLHLYLTDDISYIKNVCCVTAYVYGIYAYVCGS